MRRSGSSSCMLRPKSSLSSEDLQKMQEEPPLTVTMVNTTRLATYSTERYYMLSELEQNASSVEFVCDFPTSTNQEDAAQPQLQSQSATQAQTPEESPALPNRVMLYLLWRPNTYPTPRALVEGPILENIKRILELGGENISTIFDPLTPSSSPLTNQYGSGSSGMVKSIQNKRQPSPTSIAQAIRSLGVNTKIYVCIDRLSPPISQSHSNIAPESEIFEGDGEDEFSSLSTADREAMRLRHHKVETQLAENVAKSISTHPLLRGLVEGVSIGTTAEVRAAPGLEVCLKSVTHGCGERRRQAKAIMRQRLGFNSWKSDQKKKAKDPVRSPICLVTAHPDDLVGLDPNGEADAAQGILQSITVAEWNGKGDAVCFASRGMDGWRKAHGVEDEANLSPSGTKSFRKKRGMSRRASDYYNEAEDIAQTMVVAFIIATAAFFWTKYRDSIWSALFEFLQNISSGK